MRLKSFRGENVQLELGDKDLADLLCLMTEGAEPRRHSSAAVGEAGAGRGLTNLSSGFIVFKSASLIEFKDALRLLDGCSRGTQRVLTVWPGRYGHWLVLGSDGSKVSVEPSSSY